MTEDEIVGWHQRLNVHGVEQALGDSERQRSLACSSPWSHKESDTTERLNNNIKIQLSNMAWIKMANGHIIKGAVICSL